jgi:hypothetical protein
MAPGVLLAEQAKGAAKFMLLSIAAILFILWAVGLATAYTVGGFIHILLVVAVVIILIRVL